MLWTLLGSYAGCKSKRISFVLIVSAITWKEYIDEEYNQPGLFGFGADEGRSNEAPLVYLNLTDNSDEQCLVRAVCA